MQQETFNLNKIKDVYVRYSVNNIRYNLKVQLQCQEKTTMLLETKNNLKTVVPKNIQAIIIVHTKSGVYNAAVKILDIQYSINTLTYVTSSPQKWNQVQLRTSIRSKINIPIQITFNDNFVINEVTNDISLNGVSFYMNTILNGIYKKITGSASIQLPNKSFINTKVKYIRDIQYVEDYEESTKYLYVFKFMDIDVLDTKKIQNYFNSTVTDIVR